MRLIVIEEENSEGSRLERLLRLEPDIEILACCEDGREGVAMIETRVPDAVILGIHVPHLDGISIAAAVPRAARPPIIFISGDQRRAFDAFQLGAVDYLLPTCSHARLQEALDRARWQVRCRRQAELAGRMRALIDAYPDVLPSAPLPTLIKSGHRSRVVAPEDVMWIGAEGNYSRLHRASGDSVLVRGTLDSAALALRTPFARVHRSAAVRLSAVREVRRHSGGGATIVLVNGSTLRVGRTYRNELESKLRTSPVR